MGKSKKVALLLITLIPWVLMGLYFYWFFSIPFSNTPPQIGFPKEFKNLFMMQGFSMLLIMILLAFYLVNAYKNPRLSKDERILWIVILFMGNLFAMPIYWYLFIWRQDTGLQTIKTIVKNNNSPIFLSFVQTICYSDNILLIK